MIICAKGKKVTTMAQWSECIRAGHWKPGRSAYSLADFILNRDGANTLRERISSVLNKPVELDCATPEFLARFDCYGGNPSNLDLGICGRVGDDASLFAGLEAKVDEPFGDSTVCERYREAIRQQNCKPQSKAKDRVEDLLSNYFADCAAPCDSKFSGVRYPLLTGTAGTAAMKQKTSVFYILVFKTDLYDKEKGKANRLDYGIFIKVMDGKALTRNSDLFRADKITVAGRSLICIYDHFEPANSA